MLVVRRDRTEAFESCLDESELVHRHTTALSDQIVRNWGGENCSPVPCGLRRHSTLVESVAPSARRTPRGDAQILEVVAPYMCIFLRDGRNPSCPIMPAAMSTSHRAGSRLLELEKPEPPRSTKRQTVPQEVTPPHLRPRVRHGHRQCASVLAPENTQLRTSTHSPLAHEQLRNVTTGADE